MGNLNRFLIIGTVVLGFIAASCSKPANTVEAKKAELEKLKSQSVELQSKISKLESEIKASGDNGQNGNTVHVMVSDINPGTFKRYLNIQGTVEAMKASVISAKLPGQVISIHVNNGDKVAKGQLLLEIDDAVLQKSMLELENSLNFANTLYEKQKRLWDEKAGSEIQYLQAKNTKESLEKSVASLKQQIDNAKIYAPFEGYVDQVVPKVGEMVSPGLPVIRLTNMSEVKVVSDVSESYLSTIKQGDPVIVNLAELNQKVEAKVSVISKSINPINRTFTIEIHLPSGTPNLRPNMVCGVSINDITVDNTLIAPLSVMQRSGDASFLFVAESSSNGWVARKVVVTTGMSYDNEVQIISGLKVGDKIITSGAFDVTDGQPIKVD